MSMGWRHNATRNKSIIFRADAVNRISYTNNIKPTWYIAEHLRFFTSEPFPACMPHCAMLKEQNIEHEYQSDIALFQTVTLISTTHSTLTEQVDFAPMELHPRGDQCQLQKCRLSVAGEANKKEKVTNSITSYPHFADVCYTQNAKISLRLKDT